MFIDMVESSEQYNVVRHNLFNDSNIVHPLHSHDMSLMRLNAAASTVPGKFGGEYKGVIRTVGQAFNGAIP